MLHCSVTFQEDKKPAQPDRLPYELSLCGWQATKPPELMEASAGRNEEGDVVHVHLLHWEASH